MEKLTTKRMSLYSGRTHPALGAGSGRAPRSRARAPEPDGVRERRGARPLRRERPRQRRVHHADALRLRRSQHQRLDHGAADHDATPRYRASAKRITAVCPFYGYARQDRKAEGREPITARLIADLFKAAGAKRMVCIDLHSGQIQGFFEGPVDHLTAMPVLENYVRKHAEQPGDRLSRRRPHQGGRADVAAPQRQGRRPGVHLQAAPQGHGQRRRGQGGHRRRRRPPVHPHRRHDRQRQHDLLRRGTADRPAAPPRCGRWPPTACSAGRPSIG